MLQAPTGSGKTLIAVEAMREASRAEPVLWFWFAPFTGLVEQSRKVIAPRFCSDAKRRTNACASNAASPFRPRSGGILTTISASR